jgi:hypothetical protein
MKIERDTKKENRVISKPYPGKLPDNVLFPEKLKAANETLKSVKNLRSILDQYQADHPQISGPSKKI